VYLLYVTVCIGGDFQGVIVLGVIVLGVIVLSL